MGAERGEHRRRHMVARGHQQLRCGERRSVQRGRRPEEDSPERDLGVAELFTETAATTCSLLAMRDALGK